MAASEAAATTTTSKWKGRTMAAKLTAKALKVTLVLDAKRFATSR